MAICNHVNKYTYKINVNKISTIYFRSPYYGTVLNPRRYL